MALNYSICMLKNPLKPEESKRAYAKAQVSQAMSLKMLGKRIAITSTCSRADVEAVLTSSVENMIEALKEGYQVDFGDLGKFRLQIKSRGTDRIEDFTPDRIKNVRVRFAPGEELKNLFTGMEFVNVPSRASVRELLKQQKGQKPEVPKA